MIVERIFHAIGVLVACFRRSNKLMGRINESAYKHLFVFIEYFTAFDVTALRFDVTTVV